MQIILDLPRNAGENYAGGSIIHAYSSDSCSLCSVHSNSLQSLNSARSCGRTPARLWRSRSLPEVVRLGAA